MPWVDKEKCNGCKVCIEKCPVDAILMKNEKANIDMEVCIHCGICHSLCSQGAVRHDSEKIPENIRANLEETKKFMELCGKYLDDPKEKDKCLERMIKNFKRQKLIAEKTLEVLEKTKMPNIYKIEHEKIKATNVYKILIFTCYGGCATGVAASKACIRIWDKNPNDVKIGCLPAVIVPFKLKEILKNSKKRILIDACAVQCGKKLFEREGMSVDSYIELTSFLNIKKEKKLPMKYLEEKVYKTIQKEVQFFLNEVC